MSTEHPAESASRPNRWLGGALLGLTVAGWSYFLALGVVQATNPEAVPQITPETTTEQSIEPQDMEIHKEGLLLICTELGGAALGAVGGGLYGHIRKQRTMQHPSTT